MQITILEITILGYLVLPLGVLSYFLPLRFLLAAIVIFAPFVSASVLNAQGGFAFGIQPGLYLAMILIPRLLWRLISGRLPFVRNDPVLLLLVGFVLYGVFSAFFFPVLFNGAMVYNPRFGLDLPEPQVVEFSGTNLTQAGYLVCYSLLSILLCMHFRRNTLETAWLIKLYLGTITFVALFSFYDVASATVSLPPIDWLFENPLYGRFRLQGLAGGLFRPQSTFPEPSMLAQYLVGLFSCSLTYALRVRPTAPVVLTLLTSTLIIGLTVSATGIAGVLVMTVFCIGSTGSVKKLLTGIVLMGLLGVVVLFAVQSVGIDLSILLNKDQTASYQHRVRVDKRSFDLIWETFGLGSGLGSNRSSSLLVTMASTVGLVGTGLLGLMVLRLHTSIMKTGRTSTAVESEWLWPVYMAFIGQTVAGIIAVPDLSSLPLWLTFSLAASLERGLAAQASRPLARAGNQIPSGLPVISVTALPAQAPPRWTAGL